MSRTLLRRDVPVRIDVVPALTGELAALATAGGVPAARIPHLELAVEEVLTNICRHAYRDRPGVIHVVVRRENGRLTIEVADDGPPFDPTTAPEPDVHQSLAERPIGGLGVLLIRRSVDELRYRRDGPRNVLSLIYTL